jgi:SulP family sulfate permease
LVTEKLHELPPIVILRLRNMTALDATGLFALEEVARQLRDTGRALILCGTREQPAKLIRNSELEAIIGRENICENVQEALRRADDLFEKLEAEAAVSGV